MGSFFLHDDYRLPDLNIGLPLKRTTDNSSSAGIFENNLCFGNIKRVLGFGVDDLPSTGGTSDTNNVDEDDWTYNRARSSPVVERLILQEIQSDIVEYANTIGVAMGMFM